MKKGAFSLIELLVVIAIIAVIAAILLPIMISAGRSGLAASCLINMRQIGIASVVYASDNDEHFGFNIIGNNEWLKHLRLTTPTRIGNKATLVCPSLRILPDDDSHLYSGYAYNVCNTEKLPPEPSRTVMVGEAAIYYPVGHPTQSMRTDFLYFPDSYWVDGNKWIVDQLGSKYVSIGEWGSQRHQGQGNYVFYDGSAKRYPPEAFRIPSAGHPCSARPPSWIGPTKGPIFNPNG